MKQAYAGTLVVEVIDVRENRSAAAEYGIRVIPTQIFYDARGDERFRHEGFMSKEALLAKWRELGVDLRPPASAAEGP
jgi:thioredoxin 1